MKISEIRDLLEAEVLCCEDYLDQEVFTACGSAFVVTSQSFGSRPRIASRTQPPTINASKPFAEREKADGAVLLQKVGKHVVGRVDDRVDGMNHTVLH